MIDNVKYGLKISGYGAFSFLKIAVFGVFSAVLSLIIGIVLLSNGSYTNKLGEVRYSSFRTFIIDYPYLSVLLLITLISIYFVFSFSTQYAFRKVARRILDDKAEVLLDPIMDKVMDKTMGKIGETERQNMLQRGVDYSMLKLQTINTVKEETTNKWLRYLLVLGFSKLRLDDIPFGDPKFNVRSEIKSRVIEVIKDFATPDKQFFWMIVAYHWIVILIISFLR
ncbi:hypothetical protein HX045_04360 [Myroides odoratimimus]|uniref:Uncharacterized protein n=2 Tax=Myroides odoratimimus TaxID=76832 RepID=A0A0S7ECY1_9FLAO|nr:MULTISPECIES: hypothetical protein [Myroides]AJA68736.1 hypothetical protein MYRA21_1583 [Myroides sp. A21]ALU25998.1 hypothetical protein AS202_07505 [Myroides odoratimimus]EHO11109.1 hypothetical protein HMPREF9712_00766 [Myroides odoratimimus CCUG 10230]EHO14250.1 hypothetical protein HMPREF9714_00512 [Myroides odoratimimus CCUG 12901]EKB03904.1 hypothetical protein HMPREF9711_02089 [Myroides odoratimimus CCUG 3837]